MEEVKYYYGTLAAYNAIAVKDPDALYFITDKGMIFKGDTPVASARGIYVGTCSTSASTAAKVCEVEPFPLGQDGKPLVGTIISVKFSNTNSASNPKLNVNDTGVASIWYNDAVYTKSSTVAGYKDRHIRYMWDGTYWVFAGWSTDLDTTYTTMTDAVLKAGTSTNGYRVSSKLLKDNFDIQGRTIVMRNDSVTVPEEITWEDLI